MLCLTLIQDTQQSSTHYYSLAGHLLGELSGSTPTTSFFMTDALGSILATFSNTAGSATMLGNQLYGPYGNQRYQSGSMNTNKGYTGQYNDPVSGLDYYISRYYDPVAGVFLSPDLTQNNEEGMDPYSYVGGNPETDSDPTGQAFVPPGSGSSGDSGSSQTTAPVQNNSSYTCAWYDLGCDAHYVWNVTWNSTVPLLQKTWNETSSLYQKAWNTDIKGWDTSMQFAQQAEQVLIRTASGIAAKVIAPVVALVALAIVFVAAAIHFTGSKRGGWSENQQRQIAFDLAKNVQQERGKNTKKSPYAQGCIGIGNNPCTEYSDVVFGFGQTSNDNHAEKLIYDWAKEMIETQYQNLAPGTTINVIIYVQLKPCPDFCKDDIPEWAKALQAAAPPGVRVNLSVWYQPRFTIFNPLGNPITSPRDVARFFPK